MAGLVVAGLVVAVPRPAGAHGIGGRLDLPVPVTYFAVGAALVLIVTFALLAVLWPRPRLQDGPRYRPWRAGWMEGTGWIVRLLGVAGLLLVIAAGAVQAVVSAPAAGPTIAPVLVWVVFWLVIPFASVLAGDVYTFANPWRSLATALRLGREERPGLAGRLGVWPAAAGLLAFAWLELIWPASGSAVSLAVAASVYSVVMLAAIARWGMETALGSLDVFTVYNRLFSGIAPFGRPEGEPHRRGWLRALTVVPEWPGLWVFVTVMIGTVSYDGLGATAWWPSSGWLGQTLLMIGVVGAVALAYLGACWVAERTTAESMPALRIAQRFAHTLVPIGVAYAVSHYFTLVIYEGQQLISAASDPFGLGWDLFGTAGRRIDFFIRRPEPVWYFQVALIVAGHVTGVVLAHDRALADFEGADAVRSQYAMLVLMVLLTGLGLVILAG